MMKRSKRGEGRVYIISLKSIINSRVPLSPTLGTFPREINVLFMPLTVNVKTENTIILSIERVKLFERGEEGIFHA